MLIPPSTTQFNQPYKIHQIPVPKHDLGSHDLLIKIAVASLCHTDSMVAAGTYTPPLPCTASHEGAGTVALQSSFPSVAAAAFPPGTRIMCGLYLRHCGACADCAAGQPQYCARSAGAIGVHTHGAFAQYARVDARNAVRLPDNVTFATAAPLACAGCTIYRGVTAAAGLGAGEWLCLVGAGGGLGHLGVQFAKARGLRVVGVDARDEGLALAREAGADVVVDARVGKERVVEEVRRVTGGGGADATVTLADAQGAAALACAVTKVHGLMVQIAQPDEVAIPFHELIFRDIKIHGSLISSPKEAREMMKVVSENGISVKTNPVQGLNEIPKLLELVRSGKMAGKGIVIVDPKQIEHEKTIGATI
ncbi:alcohol dehydrogenase [Lasiodiplodia theobromae]|uniref:Alcohol dehydrogenase n=1 Tax=Lasiodiplodia theobromae TaxID=45133 RepID=A0A5N5CYZ0_9PEZI|nr:alcohol dehydrogenase [Lasiodiplodia theobromae]KAB2570561.1 alcohol dehydrogenase [Lasiodiplodia theobromae]KAF4541746.1 alcohol dehydrogenase [Lasiodiplodia theobromae]